MRTSKPGPSGQATTAPWRRWLLPAAGIAGVLAVLALPRAAAPSMPLTYTRFLADVTAGTVRAVTIGPAGQVTGSLAGGQPFTTTIPVALGGDQVRAPVQRASPLPRAAAASAAAIGPATRAAASLQAGIPSAPAAATSGRPSP